jgi:carbon-monoxide dehydrogenase large subunit
MGAHAAIVGVEPSTGLVQVLHYAVAHEGGVEINPAVVEGQIRGGVAQGIGGALLETFPYAEDGQPLTATFAEYLLPGTLDVPPVRIAALHTDATLNPLGVKGVGESGTIAVYATLASAIEDAVPPRTTRLTTTPLRPGDVLAMCGDGGR